MVLKATVLLTPVVDTHDTEWEEISGGKHQGADGMGMLLSCIYTEDMVYSGVS